MKHAIAIVLALMILTSFAAADELRHPAARKAIARAEQETRKAEEVYRQELLRIQKALVSELEKAKADAMQRQLLEEANAIQAAIDAAMAELDRLNGKVPSQSLDVAAGVGWVDVTHVKAGQRLKISATGTWCANTTNRERWTFGPEGGVVDGVRYGLVGQVGDQEFFVGRGLVFTVPADGMLRLRLFGGATHNDDGGVSVSVGSP